MALSFIVFLFPDPADSIISRENKTEQLSQDERLQPDGNTRSASPSTASFGIIINDCGSKELNKKREKERNE